MESELHGLGEDFIGTRVFLNTICRGMAIFRIDKVNSDTYSEGRQKTFTMMSFARKLTICFTGVVTAGLTGCVLDTDPVPEMPYRPRPVAPQQPAPAEEPVQTTTWENAPAASSFITPPAATKQTAHAPAPAPAAAAPVVTPAPVAAPAAAPAAEPNPAPSPVPAPAETKPAEIQPTVINLDTPPAASSSPAPAPAPEAATGTELKQITNTGPIPTAARVEGDPTRVWNPLDPSKKIRIINPKTNQPYPSGKKLKVRGTNFQFYVP